MEAFQVYSINSRYRISGTDSNFAYNINIDQNSKYDSVCVLSASVPISYYLIRDGHNKFVLIENDIETVITIPSGNYSVASFQLIIKNLLNDNSPNNWTYNISFPDSQTEAQTGRYTFTVSGNTSQPSIFLYDNSQVHRQFGFDDNSMNTFVNNILVSKYVVNFMLDNVLYIYSDILTSNNEQNILCDLYSSNVAPYSYITYVNPNFIQNSRSLSTSKSNVFHFSIVTADGEILSLNGNHSCFTLLLYKKDSVNKRMRQLLQLIITNPNNNLIK